MVVLAIEDRRLDIAHQVLEERADHDVGNLADLEIDSHGKSSARMECFEVHAAGDVLLRSLLVQLVQGRVRELLLIDGATEVERDIVHQE